MQLSHVQHLLNQCEAGWLSDEVLATDDFSLLFICFVGERRSRQTSIVTGGIDLSIHTVYNAGDYRDADCGYVVNWRSPVSVCQVGVAS